MFVFKGTAAADASYEERERDWRVADHHNIQQLGRRPFTTMLQPTLHHRSLTEDKRRPSLLQLRSRSNSSSASHSFAEGVKLSPAPSFDRYTPRTSIERQSSVGSVHKRGGSSESFSKSLMAKGSRLLRRQNSKSDLTSLHTLEWLEDVTGREHMQEARPSPIRSTGEDTSPRWNISEPFNFQHLTHTTPQHAEKIQKTHHDDLVSEFSAIRASQAPRRQLRGIKTIDIQQGAPFFHATASETSSPPWTGCLNSPLESPGGESIGQDNLSPTFPSPSTKMGKKKSIENFSQPSPSYHTAQSSPTSPPPRSSSRVFPPDFFTFHHEPPNDTTLPQDSNDKELEALEYPTTTWDDSTYDSSLPHAVTTPDNSAHPIKPPPFSLVRTELAGVPEEDEMSEGKRSSISTSIIRPTTPTSSVRHAKSFPSTRSSPQRWSGALPQPIEQDGPRSRNSIKSVNGVAPGEEEHMGEMPARPSGPRRISYRTEESWEDVIDYCYDHEAEADCSFDWDLTSNVEDTVNAPQSSVGGLMDSGMIHAESTIGDTYVCREPLMEEPRPSSSTYSSSPPSLLPLQTFLPDLQPPTAYSTESSFSSIPEAVTPHPMDPSVPTRMFQARDQKWSGPVTSTPFVVSDESASEFIYEDLYHGMLASHGGSENRLSFPTGRVDGSTISNSPRSSHSPISKSNSQESFWHSQVGATVRRHRSTGSAGSLPDLIQSRSNDKSDSSSDHLTDQISLLSTVDASVDSPQRRRSPNLAKDVALKSILSKTVVPDAEVPEVPLPVHPAFRERANSDASPLIPSVIMPPPSLPTQSALTRRMRSASSASSLSSRKANRASYSLFPSPAIR